MGIFRAYLLDWALHKPWQSLPFFETDLIPLPSPLSISVVKTCTQDVGGSDSIPLSAWGGDSRVYSYHTKERLARMSLSGDTSFLALEAVPLHIKIIKDLLWERDQK